ncbi:MAG TPA: phosphatidate cytidylyltransferase [Tepidisphaeraceae bacterium]|nr:phosphatidate cytidylyltransferase [Tepidisphaeraceae bacterium]
MISAARPPDHGAAILVGTIGGILVAASIAGAILHFTARSDQARRTIANINARIRAWWVMAAVFAGAIAMGPGGACVLFALVSFFALREMLTLAPTRRADHHTMFWAFFVIIPLQYLIIYRTAPLYDLFEIFIPVYCFLFLAIRGTLVGDYKNYLERTAKIQWGVMICVYCVSFAPALLMVDVPGYRQDWRLLVFLVLIVQMSDVLQYCWGKSLGRRKIAPTISRNKTWEGFVGGVLSATALGAALYRITPFTPGQAAGISLTIAILGFFGGIVMSAIKRDAGIKDYGHLIAGHGGMMDRIDSLTFAAPVFYRIVRHWFSA